MNKNHIFINEIVERVANHNISSITDFWEDVFKAAKTQTSYDASFFSCPQWEEIYKFISTYSFQFALYNEDFHKLFNTLIKIGNELYNIFVGDSCPSNIDSKFENYLSQYFKLVNLLQSKKILQDEYNGKFKFLNALKTGYINDEQSCFRLFSPIIIERLRTFARFITNTSNRDSKIYKNITYSVLKNMLTADIYSEGEICTLTCDSSGLHTINRYDLSSINSVSALTWLDKILANDSDELKVLVLGNVDNVSEINVLGDILSNIKSRKFEIDILFNVNNKDCCFKPYISENVIINVNQICYSKFFSLHYIDDIPQALNIYDVILLQDVPNIYTWDYTSIRKTTSDFPEHDTEYKTRYNRFSFKDIEVYKYTPINVLLSRLNMISTGKDVYGDTIEYNLNTSLIDWIQEYLKSIPKRRDAYILISKQYSIDNSEYSDLNYISCESSNLSDFYCINLSNKPKKNIKLLKDTSKKTYMVFSLWDILKNIDFSLLNSYRDIYQDAMSINIKMTWDFSEKHFLFEVCSDSKFNQAKLEEFLNDIFKQVFEPKDNVFSIRLKQAFLNTVYSQLEYLEDAVFYCTLQDSLASNIDFDIKFNNFIEKRICPQSQPIYWSTIKILKYFDYDVTIGDRIWVIKRIFEKNKQIYTKCGLYTLNTLIKYVREICENYSYTDSNLYKHSITYLIFN